MLLNIEDMFNYPSIICLVPVMTKKQDCAAPESYRPVGTLMDTGLWVSHFELRPFSTLTSEHYFSLELQLTATETSKT